MNFKTRPHFEDRQLVQYFGESIKLSGDTLYANTGSVKIEPTILDFTGTTTPVTINGLTGYLNDNNRISGLVINPPILKLSGSTGTTTVNVENFVLKSIDSDGTAAWSPISGISWSVSACTSPFLTTDIQPCTPGGTITINAGDLEINNTVRINDGSQSNGYVFTSDGSGNGSWKPSYVFTGNTSGDCITDLYITNLYGCSPITVWDNLQTVGSTASGNYSNAFGYQTIASGDHSHAEGFETTASGDISHSEGEGTLASGDYSHAEGFYTMSVGNASHAGGYNSVASGNTSFIHSTNSLVTGDRSVVLGGQNITGTTSDTVYTPNLNVSGSYLLHSDNNGVEISDLGFESIFKGGYTEFNWSGLTSNIISNSNTSGYTSYLLGDFSNFPTTSTYGFLSYYGTNHDREGGGSPLTGLDFYRNKLVLKAAKDSDGLVINPKASDPSASIWFEVDGSSVMKLKGDGGSGAYLGISLNPNGIEDPTANLQVGGTGTTGTFKYIDGNQSNGYVLTSDNLGNANWGPVSGITSTNIYNTSGVISNTTRSIELDNTILSITGDSNSVITTGIVIPGTNANILQIDDTRIFSGYVDLSVPVYSNGVLSIAGETSLNYYEGILTGDRTTIRVGKGFIIAQSQDSMFQGIKYNVDYSSNYVPRSLVDKEYVDNLLNSYGQVSITTGGTINITTAGTYQSTGLVGTLNIENNGVSLGTTDTLAIKNTSGKEQLFKIYASADIDAGNNKRLGIKLALNGTPIDETECNAPTGTGTSFAKLITNWIIRLQPNDEVALWVTNFTNTGNVTLERARIVADTII